MVFIGLGFIGTGSYLGAVYYIKDEYSLFHTIKIKVCFFRKKYTIRNYYWISIS